MVTTDLLSVQTTDLLSVQTADLLSQAADLLFAWKTVELPAGTRVYVADYDNHRIIGYNSIPSADATNADFQFGQFGFHHFACELEATKQGPNVSIVHPRFE